MSVRFIFPFILFCFVACATYQSKVVESRNLLKQGQTQEALEKLKVLSEKPSDDQLIYLLDYATALQMAGQYKESNQIFLKADQLAENQDYHSVTNLAAATFGGEEMVQYKGESFEKVLINVYLALNFLMLNQADEALVEVRRLNEKITKFRRDGRENYELNPFAIYLSALIWESERKFDDAYISYEEAYKIDGTNPFLPSDLIRSAKLARRTESYKKWKEEFPTLAEDASTSYDKSKGELIFIFQQGWGPEKQTSPVNYRFPRLYPRYSLTQQAKIINLDKQNQEATSKPVYNVEKVAIKTLEDDYAWLALRRVGSTIAKDVLARKIEEKNQGLGLIAWIFMRLSDRADLRQWSTLPQTFQIARMTLNPGFYSFEVHGTDAYGSPTNDNIQIQKIQIFPGKKTFLNWRSLH